VQHGDVVSRLIWVVRILRPGIDFVGLRMAVQIEDFNNPFLDCFAVERLFHGDASTMRGGRIVQLVDDGL
jgi:hypothetical protein